MALIKSVPTSFGVDATYWNILSIEHNRPQRSAQVLLAGYLDDGARRADHRLLAVLAVTLAGPDYPGTVGGIAYADVYERIKQQAGSGGEPAVTLAGAVDG